MARATRTRQRPASANSTTRGEIRIRRREARVSSMDTRFRAAVLIRTIHNEQELGEEEVALVLEMFEGMGGEGERKKERIQGQIIVAFRCKIYGHYLFITYVVL